jgi:hypothetical protein
MPEKLVKILLIRSPITITAEHTSMATNGRTALRVVSITGLGTANSTAIRHFSDATSVVCTLFSARRLKNGSHFVVAA